MARVPMAGPATLLALPGCAWYKLAAGPSYYTVGRAAGLLSGFRRSPYTRRTEPAVGAMCVQHVAPNLQSCDQLPDGVKTFQCKADILL